MKFTWKQHGQGQALYLGSHDKPIVWALKTQEQTVGGYLYRLHGWTLPDIHAADIAELPDVKQRAEQLVELWIHKAELSHD